MSVVQMSLYDALIKVKTLKARTENIQNCSLVVVRKMDDEVTKDGISLDTVLNTNIRPGYQQSIALLKNYINLKAAINDANAKTQITVDGTTYSIANALVLQQNIKKLMALYTRMIGNYQAVETEAIKLNNRNQSNEAINAFLEKALGDGKRNPDEVERLTKSYVARNSYGIYDPLNTREMAQKELERLEAFKDAVHRELNRANLDTMIEVEFED